MLSNFDLNQFVVMMTPLLFAVTFHEVAHGYVALRMGDPTARLAGRLSLNPLKHLDLIGSFLLPIALKLSGSPVLFGYAKPVPVNFDNLRDRGAAVVYVSAAGVVTNFILALVSGALFQLLGSLEQAWYPTILRPFVVDLMLMLRYSVIINCVLAIFNLFPIPPLDGGRILAVFLPPSLRAGFVKIERFGIIIIFFLLVSGSLGSYISFFLNPLLDLLLGK